MTPDPYALSALLRSTGKSAAEIACLLRARGCRVTSPTVESWMRPPTSPRESSRPRWHLLDDLADALDIPPARLFAAYAGVPHILLTNTEADRLSALLGENDPPDLRARLLALTADETSVDLAYHPDADPGNGAGWSLLVGDRTVAVGTLDKVLNAS